MEDVTAPVEALRTRVKPEWLDYNHHMNAACYAVAFDQAVDCFMGRLGMGEPYARSGVGTTFSLECHITYLRELNEADPIRITAQLLDFDEKKIHCFLSMYHAEQGFLAATCETISLHIDFGIRRSAPMPKSALEELRRLHEAHRELPRPKEVGRVIGIRRKAD
jgi:acyl-CoA thioester hydrolase